MLPIDNIQAKGSPASHTFSDDSSALSRGVTFLRILTYTIPQ